MKHQQRNFLEILKIELDDLQEDIETLKEICEQKLREGLITNYVHKENMALYENELHAIQTFRQLIKNTNPDQFESLEKMIQSLDEQFMTAMKSCGYARAGHICIKRKILKVANYVQGK